jgi:sigma-B regulation protein RsbU (phosphoserine phosphatase)
MDKIKILIVDSKNDTIEHMNAISAINGWEIMVASSSAEMQTWLNDDNGIGIVLIDCKFCGENFINLAHARGINPFIRFIVLADEWPINDIRLAMNKGAFDIFLRPLDIDSLRAAVNKAAAQLDSRLAADKTRRKLLALQRELEVAGSIQQQILPTVPAKFNDCEISASMVPAKNIGGDFYDFFMIDEKRLGLVIGDVSGKGISAALFMAISRALIKRTALEGLWPCECLSQVNQILSRDNPSAMFATVFYAIIDLHQKEIVYCNAGHDSPYIIKKNGEIIALERTGNMAIGFDEQGNYHRKYMQVESDDSIFLYTDGITDAVNSTEELFGRNRLEKILSKMSSGNVRRIIDRTLDAVHTFTSGTPQFDDITAIAVKF